MRERERGVCLPCVVVGSSSMEMMHNRSRWLTAVNGYHRFRCSIS
jgi:hypothetical protein